MTIAALHDMLAPATPDEIASILGDIAPSVFEDIILTGATADEVAEAYAVFEAERQGEPHRPMSVRVSALHAIIDDAFEDRDEREWDYPTSGAA